MSFLSKVMHLFFPSCCSSKDEVSQPSENEQYVKILLSDFNRIEDEVKNYQFLFGDAVMRYEATSSRPNEIYLSEKILDNKTQEVILFATRAPHPEERNTIFESSDAPLLVAIIKNENGYTLCDGYFLSVARLQRTREVQRVLDTAQNSNKVFFCNVNVEFTSTMETLKAIVYLLKQAENNKISFTAESRAQFFAQLSNYTEEEWEKLYKHE